MLYSSGQGLSAEVMSGGPTVRRESEFTPETVLSEDECKEAIAFMNHSADEDAVKKKMKLTFDYRRNMVLDPMQSSDILTIFPRFKDVKGLVSKVFIIKYLRIFKNALLLSKNKFLQGLYLIMIPFLRLSKTLF